jgi:MFS family permease
VALVGMMSGALVISPLADRFGRRNIILFCVLFFSISSCICAFVQTPGVFGLFRFLTGVGLGATIPNDYWEGAKG